VDYKNKLNKKSDEIYNLKRKIEEMSSEFAKMLKVDHFINFKFAGYFRKNAGKNRTCLMGL